MKANWNDRKYKNLTIERIDELFIVDIENGKLYRKPKAIHYWVMGEAGRKPSGNNYLTVGIDYNVYYIHDLIWYYLHHKWPEHVIDHINGIKNDNRIKNLRDVSFRENGGNQKIHRNGRLVGAQYHKAKKLWYALIRFDKVQYFLGTFKNEKDAHDAYCYARDNGIEEYWKIKRPIITKWFCYHKKAKKWIVYITTSQGKKHIGYYDSEIDAIRARDDAIMKYKDIVIIPNKLYSLEEIV